MQDFRNLEVWQVAHATTLDVYRVTASFPSSERYSLTSQLRRAVLPSAQIWLSDVVEEAMRTFADSFKAPWVRRVNWSITCDWRTI